MRQEQASVCISSTKKIGCHNLRILNLYVQCDKCDNSRLGWKIDVLKLELNQHRSAEAVVFLNVWEIRIVSSRKPSMITNPCFLWLLWTIWYLRLLTQKSENKASVLPHPVSRWKINRKYRKSTLRKPKKQRERYVTGCTRWSCRILVLLTLLICIITLLCFMLFECRR